MQANQVPIVKDIIRILKQDWKLLAAVNVFFFGTVLIGALIALVSPETQLELIKSIQGSFDAWPYTLVLEAYTSGNVLWAALLTFIFNFIPGTLVAITSISLVFPPWALIIGFIRAIEWGIALIIPVEGILPLKSLLPHYLTVFLEGEGYVIAIFACVRQIMALWKPELVGEKTRIRAYLRAVLENFMLLALSALVLAVAALYEAWEVIFFAGL